ncbi:MAG: hypothetical protein WC462_03180 [archaeon]
MELLLTMFNVGLALLVIGWAIQLVHLTKKGKNKNEIQQSFMMVYGLGIILIVLDGLLAGQLIAPALNLAVLILVLAIIMKTRK